MTCYYRNRGLWQNATLLSGSTVKLKPTAAYPYMFTILPPVLKLVETELSEALAKSSRDPPGENGSGAAHPSPAAGCTATPEGEGFMGPERDGNDEYYDRFRSVDDDEGGETELENEVPVGSVDY